MQWNDSANAGFSQAEPWLPVPASLQNSQRCNRTERSRFHFAVLQACPGIASSRQALREGEYISLNEDDPNVLSYLRRYKDQAVLVVLNMSGTPQKLSIDLGKQGFSGSKATTLLTTLRSHPKEVTLSDISLEPFAVYIAKVGK